MTLRQTRETYRTELLLSSAQLTAAIINLQIQELENINFDCIIINIIFAFIVRLHGVVGSMFSYI